VQRPLEIGGSLQIVTTNDGHNLNLFFVDNNSADNSGEVTVTAVSSAFGTAATPVSPVLNCASDENAASTVLSGSECSVATAGSAYYSGSIASFRNVLLMYEDGTAGDVRRFVAIPIGGTAILAGQPSGSVKLFFADSGPVADNGGTVTATFACNTPVPVRRWSWGAVKAAYR
jgi:hypothetical protein